MGFRTISALSFFSSSVYCSSSGHPSKYARAVCRRRNDRFSRLYPPLLFGSDIVQEIQPPRLVDLLISETVRLDDVPFHNRQRLAVQFRQQRSDEIYHQTWHIGLPTDAVPHGANQYRAEIIVLVRYLNPSSSLPPKEFLPSLSASVFSTSSAISYRTHFGAGSHQADQQTNIRHQFRHLPKTSKLQRRHM